MPRTSSLNCLSCRNPYQTPLSLNPSPLFTEKPFFFTEKCFIGSPAQKSAPRTPPLTYRRPQTDYIQKRKWFCQLFQPTPKYHTKGCSHSSADSPGARALVFAAFEPFHSCEFRASIARTSFSAILSFGALPLLFLPGYRYNYNNISREFNFACASLCFPRCKSIKHNCINTCLEQAGRKVYFYVQP